MNRGWALDTDTNTHGYGSRAWSQGPAHPWTTLTSHACSIHTHLQPYRHHTPTLRLSKACPSPAVATPASLSLQPKRLFAPVRALRRQAAGRGWAGRLQSRGSAGAAGRGGARLSSQRPPPPRSESRSSLGRASRFRVLRGGAGQRGRGGALAVTMTTRLAWSPGWELLCSPERKCSGGMQKLAPVLALGQGPS